MGGIGDYIYITRTFELVLEAGGAEPRAFGDINKNGSEAKEMGLGTETRMGRIEDLPESHRTGTSRSKRRRI